MVPCSLYNFNHVTVNKSLTRKLLKLSNPRYPLRGEDTGGTRRNTWRVSIKFSGRSWVIFIFFDQTLHVCIIS